MENYILKLNSGTEYKLYKGTALVSDTDLATLFGTAGEMYLSFDFNSGTPSGLTTFTITDSSDNAVITNTDVTVAEGKNYKATWSDSATTFDTFEELAGKALDESQLSFLMEKIKEAKEIRTVTFSTNKLNMWDKTTYPDGIYRVEYTGSGYASISLSPSGDGLSIQSISGGVSGGSYLLLGTIGYYGYRYIVGISSRANGTGSVAGGLGTIVSLYSTNGSATTRFFIGNTINGLTSTESAAPLSANQGRILNNRIGDLTTLTTTAKTSTVAAINELNAKLGDIETALNTLNNGGGAESEPDSEPDSEANTPVPAPPIIEMPD